VRQTVEDKRDVITSLMNTWNQIRDQVSNSAYDD